MDCSDRYAEISSGALKSVPISGVSGWECVFLSRLCFPIHSHSFAHPDSAAWVLDSFWRIIQCLGDQHAALIGQGCFESGMAKNT